MLAFSIWPPGTVKEAQNSECYGGRPYHCNASLGSVPRVSQDPVSSNGKQKSYLLSEFRYDDFDRIIYF
jgi:hypothetical protein